jgi:hypothetical protein
MKRIHRLVPLRVMVDGKPYAKVHSKHDYEIILKAIDRKKQKVRLE